MHISALQPVILHSWSYIDWPSPTCAGPYRLSHPYPALAVLKCRVLLTKYFKNIFMDKKFLRVAFSTPDKMQA